MGIDPKQLEAEVGYVPPSTETTEAAPDAGAEVGVEARVDAVQPGQASEAENVASIKPANNNEHFSKKVEVKEVTDELVDQIEAILADKDIMEIYAKLPENKKMIFRQTGESLARAIADAIRSYKLRPHRVLRGIREWLSLIPNVEKYYLLQEAKLDLDLVLDLYEEVVGQEEVRKAA